MTKVVIRPLILVSCPWDSKSSNQRKKRGK